jgi:adenylate cyclase
VADNERRLAAIMSADVAGYSKLMGADESGTLAALKALRADIFAPQVAAHKGRVVKLMGDGALVEFPSIVKAVDCAVAVQRAMAEQTIKLRIGINLGDIIIEGSDIYGDGVNVAARIQEAAAPGGVALSGSAHDQVAGKVEAGFTDGGEQDLKNIARPVRVWHWSDGAVAGGAKPLALPNKPSIAVLPFDNMSGDPDQAYFADGITEDIITALSRSPWLFIIARNSTFTYKGKNVDVKRVAHELGVRYVLEGSVRKAGNRIRVTALLIDGTTGGHVWSERYDGELADVFDLQDEITRNVVASIQTQVHLTASEPAKAKQSPGPHRMGTDHARLATPVRLLAGKLYHRQAPAGKSDRSRSQERRSSSGPFGDSLSRCDFGFC